MTANVDQPNLNPTEKRFNLNQKSINDHDDETKKYSSMAIRGLFSQKHESNSYETRKGSKSMGSKSWGPSHRQSTGKDIEKQNNSDNNNDTSMRLSNSPLKNSYEENAGNSLRRESKRVRPILGRLKTFITGCSCEDVRKGNCKEKLKAREEAKDLEERRVSQDAEQEEVTVDYPFRSEPKLEIPSIPRISSNPKNHNEPRISSNPKILSEPRISSNPKNLNEPRISSNPKNLNEPRISLNPKNLNEREDSKLAEEVQVEMTAPERKECDPESCKNYLNPGKLTEIINNSVKEAVQNIVGTTSNPLCWRQETKSDVAKIQDREQVQSSNDVEPVSQNKESNQYKEQSSVSPVRAKPSSSLGSPYINNISSINGTNKTYNAHIKNSRCGRIPVESNSISVSSDRSVNKYNRMICPCVIKRPDKPVKPSSGHGSSTKAKLHKPSKQGKMDNRRMTGNVNIYICSEANQGVNKMTNEESGTASVSTTETDTSRAGSSTVSASSSKLICNLMKKRRKTDDMKCLCAKPEDSSDHSPSLTHENGSEELCLCDMSSLDLPSSDDCEEEGKDDIADPDVCCNDFKMKLWEDKLSKSYDDPRSRRSSQTSAGFCSCAETSYNEDPSEFPDNSEMMSPSGVGTQDCPCFEASGGLREGQTCKYDICGRFDEDDVDNSSQRRFNSCCRTWKNSTSFRRESPTWSDLRRQTNDEQNDGCRCCRFEDSRRMNSDYEQRRESERQKGSYVRDRTYESSGTCQRENSGQQSRFSNSCIMEEDEGSDANGNRMSSDKDITCKRLYFTEKDPDVCQYRKDDGDETDTDNNDDYDDDRYVDDAGENGEERRSSSRAANGSVVSISPSSNDIPPISNEGADMSNDGSDMVTKSLPNGGDQKRRSSFKKFLKSSSDYSADTKRKSSGSKAPAVGTSKQEDDPRMSSTAAKPLPNGGDQNRRSTFNQFVKPSSDNSADSKRKSSSSKAPAVGTSKQEDDPRMSSTAAKPLPNGDERNKRSPFTKFFKSLDYCPKAKKCKKPADGSSDQGDDDPGTVPGDGQPSSNGDDQKKRSSFSTFPKRPSDDSPTTGIKASISKTPAIRTSGQGDDNPGTVLAAPKSLTNGDDRNKRTSSSAFVKRPSNNSSTIGIKASSSKGSTVRTSGQSDNDPMVTRTSEQKDSPRRSTFSPSVDKSKNVINNRISNSGSKTGSPNQSNSPDVSGNGWSKRNDSLKPTKDGDAGNGVDPNRRTSSSLERRSSIPENANRNSSIEQINSAPSRSQSRLSNSKLGSIIASRKASLQQADDNEIPMKSTKSCGCGASDSDTCTCTCPECPCCKRLEEDCRCCKPEGEEGQNCSSCDLPKSKCCCEPRPSLRPSNTDSNPLPKSCMRSGTRYSGGRDDQQQKAFPCDSCGEGECSCKSSNGEFRVCILCCRPENDCKCNTNPAKFFSCSKMKSQICVYCDNPQNKCICKAPVRKCSYCGMPLDVCNCQETKKENVSICGDDGCKCNGSVSPTPDGGDRVICVSAWEPRRNVRKYFSRDLADNLKDDASEDCCCYNTRPYGSDELPYQRLSVFSDVMNELQQKMCELACCDRCQKIPCCCCLKEAKSGSSPANQGRSCGSEQGRFRSRSPSSCRCGGLSPWRCPHGGPRKCSPPPVCGRCRTTPCRCRRSRSQRKPQAKCYYCKGSPCRCESKNVTRSRKCRCGDSPARFREDKSVESNTNEKKCCMCGTSPCRCRSAWKSGCRCGSPNCGAGKSKG